MTALMWRRSSILCVTTVALTFGSFSPAGAQTDAERLTARSAAQAGDKAMSERRYVDALDYFERAESAHHAPTLVLRIARAHAKLGQFVKAREAYLRVKREELDESAPAAFKKAQDEANAELPAIEAQIATVTLLVVGPPRDALRLELDDTALPSAVVGLPYPVDPRGHTINAVADGFEPTRIEFAVESGRSATVNVVLQALPEAEAEAEVLSMSLVDQPVASEKPTRAPQTNPGRDAAASSTDWLRVGAYASFGVGVVGLGLGGYFQLQSGGYDDDAEKDYQRCLSASGGNTCTDPELANKVFKLEKDAKDSHTNALTFFAIGGVGVAAGVVLFLLSGNDDESKTAWTPYFDGHQLGLAGNF